MSSSNLEYEKKMQKKQALKLMPDILAMLESDLMKATYDLEKAIRVAVLTEDVILVNYLATTLSALSDSSERIQALNEKTTVKLTSLLKEKHGSLHK